MTTWPRWYDREGNLIETHDEHGKLIIDRYKRIDRLLKDRSYVVVARTEIDDGYVSTVWLGVDHRFHGDGPPIIFESMIFDGPHSGWAWRYCTDQDAFRGHCEIVQALQEGREPMVSEELIAYV